MKLLHLSDLHIGKSVNGFSMLNEQRHVFSQILGYIKAEKPDAVMIAGDIYDRAVPSVEAVHLFDDFITKLARKNVTVLLISGNHDSPERLNYASRLLSEQRLHLCGIMDGKIKSVTLWDSFGGVNFWLLPFIKPSTVRGVFNVTEIESYSDAVSAVLEKADIDYTARNVLISHQFYTASDIAPIRSESEITPVGGLDAIDIGILSRFDYVALGHLHRAQCLGQNIHYAGSPIKYSFSECRHVKTVTLVELGEKGCLNISHLPLSPIHDMREIRGPLKHLLSEEISSQGNKEDYLHVTLTDEDEIADPMNKIRSVYPNVMALDFENSRTQAGNSGINLDPGKVESLSPYDLFREFFLDINGSTMSAEQSKIVWELLDTEDAI